MAATLLSSVSAHVVTLDVRVRLDEWAGLYDRLEVHRSVLGEAGPYEELTDVGYSPARLPLSASPLPFVGTPPARAYAVVGKDLRFRVGRSAEVAITFTGTSPLSSTAVATQISQQGSAYLAAYVDVQGQVAVQTLQTGGVALLECIGGEAAPHLGFLSSGPGSAAAGRDPRIPLIVGRERYTLVDLYSDPSYAYRTRFLSSRTGVTSAFADPTPATVVAAVPSEQLAIGYVRLVTPTGRPLQGQRVTARHEFLGLVADQYTVSGPDPEATTDDMGLAELVLLRGLVVSIGVENTPLARRVTVPTDPTVVRFNLFDPAVGDDDLFAVRRQDLPFAIRTDW